MRQLIRICVPHAPHSWHQRSSAAELEAANRQTACGAQFKVFLDCTTNCYADFLPFRGHVR